MKKLIAMDLDETLLLPDKSISKKTLLALDAVRHMGYLLAFATARSEKASSRAAKLVKPDFMITCGGALVTQESGKILRNITLSAESAEGVVLFCKSLPSVGLVTAETENGRYLVGTEDDPNFPGDYSHAEKFNFSSPLPCGAYKLVIQLHEEKDKKKLIEHFPKLTVFAYTGSTSVFIAAPEVNKWGGLTTIIDSLKITPKEVISFGDDLSDVEMLRKSGIGIAMGNAVPMAKVAATQICASNTDDGIALWIEENLL